MMPILYIVQGHRFDIYESIGCGIPDLAVWPSILLRDILPLVIAMASLVYAALAMRWFLIRRLQFRSILAAYNSGLTTSRYLRLIALAVTDICLLLFTSLFSLIWRFTKFGEYIQSYGSWAQVHANFSLISQSPESAQVANWVYYVVVSFYAAPLYSIVFFMFFGFGEEAITEYVAIGERARVLFERLGLLRTKEIGGQRIPALGSTVVAATDDAWTTRQDSAGDLDKHGGRLFDGLQEREQGDDGNGISVYVERSVV
ncbi:a-factor receptor [Cryptotrichosporon argae]